MSEKVSKTIKFTHEQSLEQVYCVPFQELRYCNQGNVAVNLHIARFLFNLCVYSRHLACAASACDNTGTVHSTICDTTLFINQDR